MMPAASRRKAGEFGALFVVEKIDGPGQSGIEQTLIAKAFDTAVLRYQHVVDCQNGGFQGPYRLRHLASSRSVFR